MCCLLEKDSKSLVNLIVSLQRDRDILITQTLYSELFAELFRNSPTCGILQYCGVLEVLASITKHT